MKAEIFNLQNETVGEIDLPEKVFGVRWNADLVRQVLNAQLANRRRPWAHAKNRAEVRGGGRKPWRQKGTGRARHGSIRSPIWKGGGKSHGPQKERDYSQKINKKMKRLAVFSVLSKKLKDKEMKFFSDLNIEKPKTKILSGALKILLNLNKKSKKMDLLMVVGSENKNLSRAGKNLQKTLVSTPSNLNVYDLLNYKNVFIEKEAAAAIK